MSAQRFYRFSDWVHFLGFTSLGIVFSTRSGALDLLHVFEVVVSSSLLLAFAYSFNVLCDSELESSVRLSREVRISHHSRGLLLSFFPAAVALLLVSWSKETVLLGFLVLVLWALYSSPHPRLKAIPVLCTITNGVGFSLLFLMGYTAVAPLSAPALFFFCALVLLEIPGQLIHEVTHAQGDTLLGDKTTAVQCGVKRSLEGAVLSLAGAIVLLAVMLIQGIINTGTALSAGSFAGVFALALLKERTHLIQEERPLGMTDIARFRSLRVKYKYGGIVAGVLLTLALVWIQ